MMRKKVGIIEKFISYRLQGYGDGRESKIFKKHFSSFEKEFILHLASDTGEIVLVFLSTLAVNLSKGDH